MIELPNPHGAFLNQNGDRVDVVFNFDEILNNQIFEPCQIGYQWAPRYEQAVPIHSLYCNDKSI